MDKNTIIGMLLMCAVIFGFMWYSKPSQAEIEAQRRVQDSIARVEQQRQAAAGTVTLDTLSETEINQLNDVLFAMRGDSARQGIASGGVNLRSADGNVEGTVTVGDTVLPFSEVVARQSQRPQLHNQAVAAVRKALEVYQQNGSFASALTGAEQTVTLQNDSIIVDFGTKGGIIKAVTLKGYHSDVTQSQLKLFQAGDNDYSFTLSDNTHRYETRNFYFTPKQENDSTLLMQVDLGGGAVWGLRYTLVPGSYMVRMEMVQQGMTTVIPTNINTVDLEWHQKISRHEEGRMFEERNSNVYYKYANGGSVEHLSESGDKEEDTQDNLKWISAKNQFFSTVLIADSVMSSGKFTSHAYTAGEADYEKYVKDVNMRTIIPYNSTNPKVASFYFYVGPNRYHLLSSYDKYSLGEDLKLTQLIPLGWKFFRWINTGIIIPVFDWLGSFLSNYGIIILILTILLKLVLSPLTYKSYISQAKMRILAPDIAALNEKYPGQDNAMKRQQKTMELYRLAGASPFGGCLPMLLQMPILIAMFTFFPSCIELRGQAFLWAQDLSAPDKIVEWTGQIPFVTNYFGNHVSLFCLLMTVTNIMYTYITMKSQNQSNSMPGMKWMMYLMPLMFLVFFNNYASGLSYYYFISLLITILQTYSCRLFIKEDKVRATMAANAAKPKKKSGFMARLEEAQRMQQQQLRQQQAKQNRGGKGRR